MSDENNDGDILTIAPQTANVIPGEVVIRDPKKGKKGARPDGRVCYSIMHDRPLIALGPKRPREEKDKRPKSPIEEPEDGAAFETKGLPTGYFHEGGRCPCVDGRPVPQAHRLKQIVRVARRDLQAWAVKGTASVEAAGLAVETRRG